MARDSRNSSDLGNSDLRKTDMRNSNLGATRPTPQRLRDIRTIEGGDSRNGVARQGLFSQQGPFSQQGAQSGALNGHAANSNGRLSSAPADRHDAFAANSTSSQLRDAQQRDPQIRGSGTGSHDRRGALMLEGWELNAIGKGLLDTDQDRGAVLLSTDGVVLYASPAARNHLRDGTARGRDALLPSSIDHQLARFVERMRTQRSPALEDIYYPSAEDRRLRITLEAVTLQPGESPSVESSSVRTKSNKQGVNTFVALRVHPATPWNEPTVRRLQSRFGLTLREAQVAAGVARGCTNSEVAGRLGIVEKTVKNVLMSVFTKCQVRNRVELALRAYDAPVGFDD